MKSKKRVRPAIPGFRIQKVEGRGKPWMVYTLTDGKKRATSYASKEVAEKALKGLISTRLTYGKNADAFDADAFSEWAEARDILGDDTVRLSEVALFWRDHAKRDCPKILLPEAVKLFTKEKESHGLSDRHLRDLRTRVGSFAKAYARRTVETIKAPEVLAWLKRAGGAPRTMKNNRIAVANFFNFATRRGWTDKAPAIHDADLPRVKATSKGVLSVGQCVALFAWLEAHDPQWCAWFAVQAFAGIRNAEAERLEWRFFDFARRRIVIPKEICKTGDDWVMVGLPDNLWAWLEARKGKGAFAYPTNRERDTLNRRIEKAGIVKKWPLNALRHSFATYHMSTHESADKTAILMRHRSTAMLWQSYLATMVPKVEAAGYFEISPSA